MSTRETLSFQCPCEKEHVFQETFRVAVVLGGYLVCDFSAALEAGVSICPGYWASTPGKYPTEIWPVDGWGLFVHVCAGGVGLDFCGAGLK